MAPLSFQQAFSYSLKLLSDRQYSESALLEKLQGKGCSKQLSLEIVERLRELNLLNDKAFAGAIVDDLVRFHPSGRRRIRSVLKKKKVPSEIAGELVSKMDVEEEAQRAKALAEKYDARWHEIPKMRRLKRIYDLLVRRGFEYEMCRQIIEELR